MKISIRALAALLFVFVFSAGCSDSQRARSDADIRDTDIEPIEDALDPGDIAPTEDATLSPDAVQPDVDRDADNDANADATADSHGEDAQIGEDIAEVVEPAAPAKIWSHFNWPADHDGSDPTITNELIRMIEATPDDGQIRGNFFILDLAHVAAALNAAYDRGVRVRISLDGGPSNRGFAAARSVATHMGTSAGYCGGTDGTRESLGCITDRVAGIAHSKFMVFSETVAPDGVLYPNVT